jgi:hypothetical protein
MTSHRALWRDMIRHVLFFQLVVLIPAPPLSAQIPNLINYQGRLTDAQGNPVNGNRTMAVRIYDKPTGGEMTYEETIGTVAVKNGLYSFQFGSGGSISVPASETIVTTNGINQVFNGALQGNPLGGQINLSDGTYSWSSSGGSSNPTAFGVTYNASARSFQIIYFSSQVPLAGRPIVASYQTLQSKDSIVSALTLPEAHLALVIDSVEESKRSRLLAVPYALRADSSQVSADAQGILNGDFALPIGSIGPAQLSNNAVEGRHLAEGSVDSKTLAAGTVSSHQVASGNITAEPNKTYFVNSGQEPGVVFLPENPQIGDVVRVVGEGALVRAPEGAAILHDWTARQIETATENASFINQIFCSDDANIIYAAVSAQAKDSSITERQTIAISLDGAKTWNFLPNLSGNSTAPMVSIHGCSSNGSCLLCMVDSKLKILENFGNTQINIALPDGVSNFDFVRLTLDGNRIIGFSSMSQSLYVSDNLGQNWRQCALLANGEEIQFFTSGPGYSPLQFSQNGSVILAPARRVADSKDILVFSEDAGASWRILQLPLVNEMELMANSLQTGLSRDGSRIYIFNEPQTFMSGRARLVSYDKGITWDLNRLEYSFSDSGMMPAPNWNPSDQVFQSVSSGTFYFGSMKSIDSGITWVTLPRIHAGMPWGETPSVQAISFDGNKLISKIMHSPEFGGNLLTSWKEELRCVSSLEFFYIGEGLWNLILK